MEENNTALSLSNVFGEMTKKGMTRALDLDVKLTKEDIIAHYVSSVEEELEKEREKLVEERETLAKQLSDDKEKLESLVKEEGRKTYGSLAVDLTRAYHQKTGNATSSFLISDSIMVKDIEGHDCIKANLFYTTGKGVSKHNVTIDTLEDIKITDEMLSLMEKIKTGEKEVSDVSKKLMGVMHKLGNMDRVEREAKARTARRLIDSMGEDAKRLLVKRASE